MEIYLWGVAVSFGMILSGLVEEDESPAFLLLSVCSWVIVGYFIAGLFTDISNKK